MAKKATVDKKKCIGCGSCAVLAPGSFKLGDDGKAKGLDPAGDDEATIQNTVDSCPGAAISWQK